MKARFLKLQEFIRQLLRKPKYRKQLGGKLGFTKELIAHKPPSSLEGNGGGSETIRISNSEGQSVTADVSSKQIVDFSIEGKSRQGEAGVLKVCEILIERLNQEGAQWSRPIDLNAIEERKEEGVDCEAYDDHSILHLQVTRVERGIWRDLSNHGAASKKVNVQALVESIRAAILSKSRAISIDQRKELILALDAIETPDYAFEMSVKVFRETYRNEISALGFKGIWLVGPTVTMTHRLD